MKRHLLFPLQFVAAAVLLGLLVSPLEADDCRWKPFEFHSTGNEIIEGRGNCFTVVGTGIATHLGEVVTVNEICQFGFRAVGEVTITAQNGEQLFMVREVEWNPETERFEGPFTIIGGTGRFEDASGGGIHFQGEGSFGVICY